MKNIGVWVLYLLLINVPDTRAATEFGESIPTRLAKIFMGIDPADPGLYADINDEFPSFSLPAEFMVIGSINRGYGNTVHLSTTLDDAEARQVIAQAFKAEGWQEVPVPSPRPGPAGFTGGGNERIYPTMLCHDELANLQINTTQTADELLMTISHQGGAFIRTQSCAEIIANSQQGAARFQAYRDPLQQYLPRLELPVEVSRGRSPGSVGGISGGSDEVTAHTDLVIDWDLAQVFDFFAEQVAAQGWTPEGNSLTALIAGGSWTLRPEEEVNLLGRLSVIKRADSDYRLEFNLISLPAQTGN